MGKTNSNTNEVAHEVAQETTVQVSCVEFSAKYLYNVEDPDEKRPDHKIFVKVDPENENVTLLETRCDNEFEVDIVNLRALHALLGRALKFMESGSV